MPDLHGWITQQIDATETAAHKAAELCGCHPSAPSWSFGDETTDGRIRVDCDPHPGVKRKIGRRWNGSYEGMFMAEHIVLHDPAAVLRRCTADRKILAAHPYTERVVTPYGQPSAGFGCETCHDRDGVPEGRGNCATILALAEGYALTPELLATLDRPKEGERPEPRAFRIGPPARPTSSVPPALRGPNWKATP